MQDLVKIKPITLALPCKVQVCCHLIAAIAGSKLADGTDVSLSGVLRFV
jgi:hypothetical protein